MYELVNKIKESRILYVIYQVLLYASTDKNANDRQDFLMVIQENSNKVYPPMVTQHQKASEYSIISQKITHSFFEVDKFLLLNLLN